MAVIIEVPHTRWFELSSLQPISDHSTMDLKRKLKPEIAEWAEGRIMLYKTDVKRQIVSFWFDNEDDALLFKLTWL